MASSPPPPCLQHQGHRGSPATSQHGHLWCHRATVSCHTTGHLAYGNALVSSSTGQQGVLPVNNVLTA